VVEALRVNGQTTAIIQTVPAPPQALFGGLDRRLEPVEVGAELLDPHVLVLEIRALVHALVPDGPGRRDDEEDRGDRDRDA
jgi:hypothetical protein